MSRCMSIFKFSLIVLSVVVLVFAGGCQWGVKKAPPEDEQTIARVDNYRIIVSDFETIADHIFGYGEFPFCAPGIKEKALEDLITRAVLVQEAQNQNLDKQEVFMKEIERYWTQSLVKFILKKKSEDISRTIYVEEVEVKNEYRRRMRKVFAEFVVLSDKSAAEQLSVADNNFEEIRQTLKGKIISVQSPQWREVGDLPARLDDHLFSLSPEEISKPIEYENKWVVIRVLKIGVAEIKPYEDLAPQIRREIAKRKQEEALENWLSDLKKKADIEVSYELLEQIDLEKLCGIK